MTNFDELYRKEWRELGFYYQHDDNLKTWTFVGDQHGLNKFSQILREYVKNPSNKSISEHKHLGPQEYLKIITWSTPFIGKDGIYGSFDDLKRLSDLFDEKLSKCLGFTIDKDYSNSNKAQIHVIVKQNGFDPASLDESIESKS